VIVELPERGRRKPCQLTDAGHTTLQANLTLVRVVANTGLRRLTVAASSCCTRAASARATI